MHANGLRYQLKENNFDKTRKHLESSYKSVAPKNIYSVIQVALDMMQPDEIEKFIKENIKIPDEIDVSFLLLEREATAMEIGITVSIVFILLLILGGSIWACVARNALETRYPKVCNCQCPYCPRNQLHDMEAEVEYAETIINATEVDDEKEVFQHFEGPVWFETTDESQGLKITKICDEGECVTKKMVRDKLKRMGFEGAESRLRFVPKVLDGETIMILKL